MTSFTTTNFRTALSSLQQLMRERAPLERCELCSAGLADDHTHLIQLETRQLMCVCDECAISFGETQAGNYRRIPRRVKALPNLQLDDAQWDALYIPVGMAFFFYNSFEKKVVAYYPSPAGATESLLDLASWQDIVQANPMLNQMEPDVEALMVNRIKGTREYYLVGLDQCYELVGLVRINWHGLSGGEQVWQAIDDFFARLRTNCPRSPSTPLRSAQNEGLGVRG